jgi:alcohol dehydrogenase (cytochrome c)
VAVDARTGEEACEANVGADDGYQFSSGSIIADGTVVAGLTGCGIYRDDTCYIVGLDAETGREMWRTSTIAKPGEPGGDSWGDLPVMFRAGSDAWISGSYDAASRTILIGTSQAKPWHRQARGTDGDALYTNSTLALDPQTGELKWYYQHLPAETHDMDEVFERIVIEVDGQPSVFSMGKIGVLWQLDLATGQFQAAHDLGYQTLVDVDPSTGAISYREGALKDLGEDIFWCPSTSGFKSWRAMAYHPETEALYIPLILNCETGRFGPVEKVAGAGGSGPVRRTNHVHPDSPDHLGEFAAMDIKTGEILWSHRYRTPINSAALTTAGGLAFAGDWDRHMYAYDVRDGEVLWQTRLPQSVQGYPITYTAGGKQYLAVGVGTGGASWTSMPLQLTPEKHRPVGGNGLFVFALPD